MADDEQFDMDDDDDDDSENEEEEVEGSDDDTGFFPIDEPIVHSTQATPTTTISKQTKEQTGNKYSTSINASNNYPQDNNFEYVGKKIAESRLTIRHSIKIFSFISRRYSQIYG